MSEGCRLIKKLKFLYKIAQMGQKGVAECHWTVDNRERTKTPDKSSNLTSRPNKNLNNFCL